ncbi:hypothetical protein KM1_278620, partial [Entamoeba histolytica HM-3:IMSS]
NTRFEWYFNRRETLKLSID